MSFFSGNQLSAQYIEKKLAFEVGEKLIYRGYYNWGFIWVAAGEVTMSVEKQKYHEKDAYKFCGIGKNLKAFDWFFHLRDTLTAYVDIKTIAPLYFDRRTHEAKYHAHHEYWFNYTDSTIYSKIQKRKKPVKLDTIACKPRTFDILSVAYFVRNIDFGKYKKGDRISISMLVDNKIHNLYVRYRGLETIKTRSRERFECIKLSPLMVEGTMFKSDEEMTVWLSNDDNRIPIMVEAKILIGSVKGVLDSYEGLRNSPNSILKKRKGKVEIKE